MITAKMVAVQAIDRLGYRWRIRRMMFLDQWLRWIREELLRTKRNREWKGW